MDKPRIYVDFNEMVEDEFGNSDSLVMSGIVERNKIKEGWGAIAKWCCRIGSEGIQYESDIR